MTNIEEVSELRFLDRATESISKSLLKMYFMVS